MKNNAIIREFHISHAARQKYQFDETLYASSGNAIFANYHGARVFAYRMNQRRDTLSYPEHAVKASDLYAMGLIDEILHYVLLIYGERMAPEVMKEAFDFCQKESGQEPFKSLLNQFITQFPPAAVYQGKISGEAYQANPVHPPVILEEIIMLWLANVNPAFSPFLELFDDTLLEKSTVYHQAIETLNSFFKIKPFFGPDNQPLIEMLRAPAIASPHSLAGQLDFIRTRWGALIQDRYLYKLLSSLDFIREETKSVGLGGGPVSPPDFLIGIEERERFSADLHWMPHVVMIAKNVYVWLDQLSRQTGQTLTRLDQIPDESLDTIARWGFTALWLIGVWERSPASKRIKQMCGNPEAEASAYALYDYQIASDLGGEVAFQNLKTRAWQRGIRMAGDMIPNHVGIDSRWVIQHPDWFISLPYSPFPAYGFNGINLSHDERVGIYLEDHYYNRTDAAVVFKRKDHWTGDEMYIYHGNDGTNMPWNDTAQLNFLKPEVREALIQTILHVAKQFPVIRFDAAMTLTHKHFQRLWFPEPGLGGDIASRAGHGITRAQFLQAMPMEFWREVVDRVAVEAPDTLLLAEAFWLLEGYFVRTLGMHRVYNSAFMNMLKNEDNGGYRDLIRKTMSFNPEILKRFVNFMSNPDEQTAVAQFGKDDKYFGVCLLMCTMPGLPMFGHGQIEGFTEKYGMEYRRAYWDEEPDSGLIKRHEHEIFPVLRRRALFSEVKNYCLYDLITSEGHVNENVFAQSNRSEEDRALCVYHNTWAETRGWVRSNAVTGKSLGHGLGLNHRENYFTIFQDHISGLEFIRNNMELFTRGLYVELGAFKYHLFWNFRQVADDHGDYRRLYEMLNGRGVPSIDEALKELGVKPVMEPFCQLIHSEFIKSTLKIPSADHLSQEMMDDFRSKVLIFYTSLRDHVHGSGDVNHLVESALSSARAILTLLSRSKTKRLLMDQIRPQSVHERLAVLGWAILHPMGTLKDTTQSAMISRSWVDELLLGKVIQQSCDAMGFSSDEAWQAVMGMKICIGNPFVFNIDKDPATQALMLCRQLFGDSDAQRYIQVNRYQEILYFNKERFEALMRIFFSVLLTEVDVFPVTQQSKVKNLVFAIWKLIRRAEERSGFQVEALFKKLEIKPVKSNKTSIR